MLKRCIIYYTVFQQISILFKTEEYRLKNKFSAFLFAALASAAVALSGCTEVVSETPNYNIGENTSANTIPPLTVPTESEDIVIQTTIDPIVINVPKLQYTEFSQTYEAEDGTVIGSTHVSDERKGFSGDGYVTSFSGLAENDWELTVDIPYSQHYNITVCLASDDERDNFLTLDGVKCGEMITNGDGEFETVMLSNVYINSGETIVGIEIINAGIDVDWIKFEASDEPLKLEYSPDGNLSNPNALDCAKGLYDFICENFGKKTISGQFCDAGSNREIRMIADVTGKEPAIRFSDLSCYTGGFSPNAGEFETAVQWAESGGIVGYIWSWEKNGSINSEESGFDLSKSVTSEDIASLSPEELDVLAQEGKITEECRLLIKEIDNISSVLAAFRDSDIPVLFRPLMEASGGWYWWGSSGKDAYLWLWELMYERMTEYHKLGNLVWIWNAQDADWYVGDELCDIISADIYDGREYKTDSKLNGLIALNNISDKKPIALSECDSMPYPLKFARDNAFWSWFSLWKGGYVLNSDGSLNEDRVSRADLIFTYNCNLVITLEDLKS